ncbi:hypothetical protein U8527_15420 [Kordia algicida OT-1]|uniref:Uncharacterized protein n=1 Tax=Kordia algicida OT-1 TaxID=391587 RepID=A9E7Y3_9FLAO|nr:hypothetical protein [Kordia algicida]EDP94945.1 hypothetical protein KAOT1_09029 [Kordia algicida OT-1]
MRLLFIFLLTISSNFVFATSPQLPDLLKIGNDTIYIYTLPLEGLSQEKFDKLSHTISKFEKGLHIGTNLWRGFQAVWEFKNNQLYLTDIKDAKHSKKILQTVFPHFKNGVVKATWFSSFLVIPKDKMLRWDGVAETTYLKEEILHFRKGNLKKRKLLDNHIEVENGISRINQKSIPKILFEQVKKLDWETLSKDYCDDKYIITIGKKGKVTKVKIASFSESKWDIFWDNFSNRKCNRLIRKNLRELQFDIIKWHGKPIKETYELDLFYDDDEKKLKGYFIN